MAVEIRQVIRIYRNEDLINTYCIELVNCDENMIEADEQLRSKPMYGKPITEIYYICPRIASCRHVFDVLREELFNYRIRKNDHYEFADFNRHFYQAITSNQWIAAAECVLLNNIYDEDDTLKQQFIKRLRKRNITMDTYKPKGTLKYPIDPESIFVDFDWNQV